MNDSKILMAYFSRSGNNYVGNRIVDLKTGNTEVAAKFIGELTGATLFKIDTLKSYPVDYTETTKVAQAESRTRARPALSHQLENIDGIETVILGYPNWWGTMPMAVFTFLESFDFAGKVILPLCTHEGSGLGISEADICTACPGAKVLKGLALVGSDIGSSKSAIQSWLKASGIAITGDKNEI